MRTQSNIDTTRIVGAVWGLWERIICSVAVVVIGIVIIIVLHNMFGWTSDWMLLIPVVVMLVFILATRRFLTGVLVGLVSFGLSLLLFSVLPGNPIETADLVIYGTVSFLGGMYVWLGKPNR